MIKVSWAEPKNLELISKTLCDLAQPRRTCLHLARNAVKTPTLRIQSVQSHLEHLASFAELQVQCAKQTAQTSRTCK